MKNALLKGTFILTITGLLTRILGFLYRIYLADTIGAELLGIYQLVFPVYGVCFTLYASGIQTAISKLAAEEYGAGNPSAAKRILRLSIPCSFCIALLLSVLLSRYADPIAANVLMEARTAPSLRILALVFPFCSITACINGYYYGLKKTAVPAGTQLLEQLVRIASVFLFAALLGEKNGRISCELAVLGVVFGEIFSTLYNVCSLGVCRFKSVAAQTRPAFLPARRRLLGRLAKFALPLSLNRLIINLLHSLEAVLVPYLLKRHGLSAAQALSLYGILNGMAMPFLLFPSTVTNSLSVLLLPAVSEAKAVNNRLLLEKTTALSVKYSLIIGIFSSSFFLFFGNELGSLFFGEALAGAYLRTLSFLCPFLYVSTTLNSIINGLGKAHLTFFNSVLGMAVRIALLLFFIPRTGIYGYFIGLLVSQLLITLCDSIVVLHYVRAMPPAKEALLIPCLTAFLLSLTFSRLYAALFAKTALPPLLLLAFSCLLFAFCFFAVLLAFGCIRREELH